MTPEELIEAESDWLEQLILSVQNAALQYHETGGITAFNSNTIALAHFKALNEWGVRVPAPGVRYIEKASGPAGADALWVVPLPEKE